MFSALRPGSILYILDKSDGLAVKTGCVENITQPRPMYKTYNPAVSFGTNMQTVVDVTVKVDGEKKEIVGLNSNNIIQSQGDYVISETREAMISEVDSMLQNSKNVIESVDQHKQIIEQCESILRDLNPVYAKEQERDDAIEDLTAQVNNMQSILNRLENLLIKKEQNGNN